MSLGERVPDPEVLGMGSAILLLAVVIWIGLSVIQGNSVDFLETIVFALVFGVLYFGGLTLLNRSEADAE